MKIKLFIAIALVFILATDIYSQNDSTIVNEEFKEIICYRYNFYQGDTLYYRNVSHDSIIIGMEPPLLRIRNELYELVCDSVGKKTSYFYLSMTLREYKALESKGDDKNIERKTTPWLNRKVFLVIDSLGNRIQTGIDDISNLAMSPGGAFNPYLFFGVNGYCKTQKESWISKSLDTIVENGNPAPLINRTVLFRAYQEKDTLGQICQNLTYISTGQGSILLRTPTEQMSVTSVLAGSGNLYISKKDLIPVYQFANIEQKLRIFTPENEDGNPAWHYTSAEFLLEKFIPGKKRNIPVKNTNNKSTKNRKNGKKN